MSTPWIRVLALSSLAAFCLLCPNPSVPPAAAGPPPGYTLTWSDEFDEPTGQLDTSKWGYLLLANQFGKFDEGCNVTGAVSLDGQGNLVITTWTDSTAACGNPPTPHQTGMIATGDDRMPNGQPWLHLNPPGDKRVARYGYVEARIMFTGAQSVWSSYWFQSPTYGVPLHDPRTAGTEIDVIEHLFNSPDAPSALHWDAYCQNPPDPTKPPGSAGSSNHSGCGNLNIGFHTYGLEWTPDVLRYYYDAVLVWTVNNSPQTDPPSQITCPWSDPGPPPPAFLGPVSRAGEYIMLDNEVRVAGTDYGPKGDSRNAKMTVDYVRWYEDKVPPPPIQLSVPSRGRTTMAVSWPAPGDDGTGQPVTQYDLRYSTSLITASNFSSATQVPTGVPHAAGYPECQVISGLTKCKTYYFAIKSMDEVGNWSAISNVQSANTQCQVSTATCPTVTPDNVPPGNVFNLSVSDTGNTTVALSWTAPGDDGLASGTASEYDLRYSPSSIDASNFDLAAHATIAAPQAHGSPECVVVRDLCASTPFYFAIKTKDEWGNWSGISNPASVTTKSQNRVAACTLGGGVARAPLPGDATTPRSFSAPRPNPARGATSFRISVPSESRGVLLRVGVFDVQGRRVRSLVNRIASPGPAQIDWNLLDDSGHRVASGLYMVRVDMGDVRKTFRLVVVR